MQTKQIQLPSERIQRPPDKGLKSFLSGLFSGVGLTLGALSIKKCAAKQNAPDAAATDTLADTAAQTTAASPQEPEQPGAAAGGMEQSADGQEIITQFQNDLEKIIEDNQSSNSQSSAQSLQEALDALLNEDALNAEQRQALDILKNIVLAYIHAITEANKKKTPAEHNAELDKGKDNITRAAADTEYISTAEQLKNLLDKWKQALPLPPKPLTPAERRALKLAEFKANVESYKLRLKTLLRYSSTYNLTDEDEANITQRLNNLEYDNERDFKNLTDTAAIQAYENDLNNFIDGLRGKDIDPLPK
ncbi:hypothetical protein NO1_0874 [Candidatus Termititenax aidoneus]|uniref:Uncharacterized protein n=1 Tax=Termititenax aidoneus TaxID=2218524 RepID=A0A388TAZ9_TERA1|nr:hypothetical protein NO1_0874 [Candidatus Termititenax aidoneus]